MHVCILIFSLLPAPSGTHNHTQIYKAVNTLFLEPKWNRGTSNRCFSGAALGSILGTYLSNLAIFHDILNNDVLRMQLRALTRAIKNAHCVLGRIRISKQIPYFLHTFCQGKVSFTLQKKIPKPDVPHIFRKQILHFFVTTFCCSGHW